MGGKSTKIDCRLFFNVYFWVDNRELFCILFHAKHQATLLPHDLMCSNKNTEADSQVESLLFFDIMHIYSSKNADFQ